MNKKTVLAYSMLLASLVSKNTSCFFKEMREYIHHVENRMHKMFADMEQRAMKIEGAKGVIDIVEKDNKAIITIELGKNIKEADFDAKIKTKKAGYKMDQIIVKIKKPQKQDIAISIVGNYLAVEQSSQQSLEKKIEKPTKTTKLQSKTKEKTFRYEPNGSTLDDRDHLKIEDKEEKPKIEEYSASYQSSFSQMSKTMSKKLNIEKVELEYDEKEGILTIEIRYIQEDKRLGKKIGVKIKRDRPLRYANKSTNQGQVEKENKEDILKK